MGFYRVIKKILKKISEAVNFKSYSLEDDYYSHLFIEHSDWNKAAPNVEENKRWEIIKEFLLHIENLNPHSDKKKILDLGCGRGWLTKLLADYGEVTGIEPVKKVVNYGKKLFPELDLRHGTGEDLLAQNCIEEYDLVVCSEVIEHIPNLKKKQFLNNIYKLLKPGGFVIVTTPRKEAEEDWKKYGAPDQPVEEWLSENDLQKMFNVNNFEAQLLKRFSIAPVKEAPAIEIYQLWLAIKN